LEQLHCAFWKAAWLLPPDNEGANHAICADQWHNETSSEPGSHGDIPDWTCRLVTDIGDLLGSSFQGRVADRIGNAKPLYLERRN
jgi:hypothetical protein